jgi:hypothetical protein
LKPYFSRKATELAQGRHLLANEESFTSGLDVALAADNLLASGYSGIFNINPELVDDILNYVDGKSGDRFENPHLTCDAIRKIALDPQVIEVMRRYFGVDPILYGSIIMIGNASNSIQKPAGAVCKKEFHYDVPDFKGLTMFIYLNDVDIDGGAHVVIPSTNDKLTIDKIYSRFMPYKRAVKRFGEDRMVTIVGSKGTAFIEDLVNWHKRSNTNRKRTALSVTYTLHRKP